LCRRAARSYPNRDVDGSRADLAVTDLHVQGIDEHSDVDRSRDRMRATVISSMTRTPDMVAVFGR